MALWHNLWPFGTACGHWVYFSRFGMFGKIKIWQPWPAPSLKEPTFRKVFRLFLLSL
jgi:hypothetical protein